MPIIEKDLTGELDFPGVDANLFNDLTEDQSSRMILHPIPPLSSLGSENLPISEKQAYNCIFGFSNCTNQLETYSIPDVDYKKIIHNPKLWTSTKNTVTLFDPDQTQPDKLILDVIAKDGYHNFKTYGGDFLMGRIIYAEDVKHRHQQNVNFVLRGNVYDFDDGKYRIEFDKLEEYNFVKPTDEFKLQIFLLRQSEVVELLKRSMGTGEPRCIQTEVSETEGYTFYSTELRLGLR